MERWPSTSSSLGSFDARTFCIWHQRVNNHDVCIVSVCASKRPLRGESDLSHHCELNSSTEVRWFNFFLLAANRKRVIWVDSWVSAQFWWSEPNNICKLKGKKSQSTHNVGRMWIVCVRFGNGQHPPDRCTRQLFTSFPIRCCFGEVIFCPSLVGVTNVRFPGRSAFCCNRRRLVLKRKTIAFFWHWFQYFTQWIFVYAH